MSLVTGKVGLLKGLLGFRLQVLGVSGSQLLSLEWLVLGFIFLFQGKLNSLSNLNILKGLLVISFCFHLQLGHLVLESESPCLCFFGLISLFDKLFFSLCNRFFSLVSNFFLFLNQLWLCLSLNLCLFFLEYCFHLLLLGQETLPLFFFLVLFFLDLGTESILVFLLRFLELEVLLVCIEVLFSYGFLDQLCLPLLGDFFLLEFLFFLFFQSFLLLLLFFELFLNLLIGLHKCALWLPLNNLRYMLGGHLAQELFSLSLSLSQPKLSLLCLFLLSLGLLLWCFSLFFLFFFLFFQNLFLFSFLFLCQFQFLSFFLFLNLFQSFFFSFFLCLFLSLLFLDFSISLFLSFLCHFLLNPYLLLLSLLFLLLFFLHFLNQLIFLLSLLIFFFLLFLILS